MKSKDEQPKIIAIVGPTASGKTDAARRLALAIDGEIISADSRQVYRGLDIGTGKEGELLPNTTAMRETYPTVRYLDGIPQWLVDIVPPQERYTAAHFQQDALLIINDIIGRGKIPIIVGGTGLYVSALIEGYDFTPHERSVNNPRHAAKTGTKNPPPWETLLVALDIPRPELYRRIDERVEKRIEQGMVEEGRTLVDSGLTYDDLRRLGLEYKFLADLLEGKLTRDEFASQLKFAIHAYARRQITWWRGHGEPVWLSNYESIESAVGYFLC